MDENLTTNYQHLEEKDNRAKAKSFVCELCDKVLASKKSLNEHRNVHNGVSPYMCFHRGCNMKFKQSSALSAHKKVHKAIEKIVNEDDDERLDFIFKQTKFFFEDKDFMMINQIDDPIFTSEELKLPPIVKKD
jgi:uncharacterized Zn-finger protein